MDEDASPLVWAGGIKATIRLFVELSTVVVPTLGEGEGAVAGSTGNFGSFIEQIKPYPQSLIQPSRLRSHGQLHLFRILISEELCKSLQIPGIVNRRVAAVEVASVKVVIVLLLE